MIFLQTIIQVIVGAAVLRTLPMGTIFRSPHAMFLPYRFCGIVGNNVMVTLGLTETWTNTPRLQSFSIEYVATNWTIDASSGGKAVSL